MEGPFNLGVTRSEISAHTLQPEDDLEAAIAGGVHLAWRRADALRRPPTQEDLQYALSVFCWYWFKTEPPAHIREQLISLRQDVFRGTTFGEFERLDRLCPTRTLTWTFDELIDRQQQSISAFLDIEQPEQAF